MGIRRTMSGFSEKNYPRGEIEGQPLVGAAPPSRARQIRGRLTGLAARVQDALLDETPEEQEIRKERKVAKKFMIAELTEDIKEQEEFWHARRRQELGYDRDGDLWSGEGAGGVMVAGARAAMMEEGSIAMPRPVDNRRPSREVIDSGREPVQNHHSAYEALRSDPVTRFFIERVERAVGEMPGGVALSSGDEYERDRQRVIAIIDGCIGETSLHDYPCHNDIRAKVIHDGMIGLLGEWQNVAKHGNTEYGSRLEKMKEACSMLVEREIDDAASDRFVASVVVAVQRDPDRVIGALGKCPRDERNAYLDCLWALDEQCCQEGLESYVPYVLGGSYKGMREKLRQLKRS